MDRLRPLGGAPMRLWILLWAACSDTGDGAGSGDGGPTDADTDADTDTDTDTDSGGGAPVPLICAEAACDGDPTGDWTIYGECMDDPRFAEIEADCPGNTVTLYQLSADGSVSFSALGDYAFYVGYGSTGIGIVVPPACNEGCLTYELPDLGVACTTTGEGGCECNGAASVGSWYDSGTWTRDGGTLALQSASTLGIRNVEVCASGTQIWLYDPNSGSALGGVATVPTQ